MGMFRKRRIYLDYASAPPVLPEALRAMREAEHLIGNPGAIHEEGVAMRAKLEDARARIAALLGIKAREIVFTSGLTESNNLAILGFARKLLLLCGNRTSWRKCLSCKSRHVRQYKAAGDCAFATERNSSCFRWMGE